MTNLASKAARVAGLTLLLGLIGACGGGDFERSDKAATAQALGSDRRSAMDQGMPTEHSLGASVVNLGEPNTLAGDANTTLIVRAYSTMAANIGPLMQLRVDGVAVRTVEVRASEPTDYAFAVPMMRTGSKVDVVYTNDGRVNGADRNLYIDYLISGTTFVLPKSAGVTYDRGIGALAFDGRDVVPGQGAMVWDGALRMIWPAPNLTDVIAVRAKGELAGNVGPKMQLRVDGITLGTAEVRETEFAEYRFASPPLRVGSQVDLVFTNNAVINGEDRNLIVAQVLAGTTLVSPDSTVAIYDIGVGNAAFDGLQVSAGRGRLTSNGALRLTWPRPNMTDVLTVRASGSLASNVGPIMQLHIDGSVVGSTEVRSSQPIDYRFAVPPMRPGSKVDVVFANDGVVAGADRNLFVSYLISGETVISSDAPGVVYDRGTGTAALDGVKQQAGQRSMFWGGALRFAWPDRNMTNVLTVRARGNLAGNVGPLMQVRVDDVVAGTVEVRSAESTDYKFPVLPLAAGSKVEVVFTNDATVEGVDRNLVVDYLLSDKTHVLPTSPGVVYDRGSGAAAFDGKLVQPGRAAMSWGGALRLMWPETTFTDTLTVRASGTPAAKVGPIMQIRVDDLTVGTIEVRATEPTDFNVAVPQLHVGSKIDVVFVNDANTDGADRNLHIDYLVSGTTFATPTSKGVSYDLGVGAAAFDGVSVVPGRSVLGSNGALRFEWPARNITNRITVRARATLAGNVGALMQVRVNGVIVGTQEVRSPSFADHIVAVPPIAAGSRIDIAFINDAIVNGQDRNLYVAYIKTDADLLMATAPTVLLDVGVGSAAFDGVRTSPGAGELASNGALRFVVPEPPAAPIDLAAQFSASRFLHQATFGATPAEINRVVSIGMPAWIDEQISMPIANRYVQHIQSKFDLGDAWRPDGSNHSTSWCTQRFWSTVPSGKDQLGMRVAFALHQTLMASLTDTAIRRHTRAYASYLDILRKHAFGNYRQLLEEIALSPAMGIYLSHMRNQKEDPGTGRSPDENFAREMMQLFSIGLVELNIDGTPKQDARGREIATYSNTDVVALAKVFTGWSWAFPDNQLTEANFRWGNPDYSKANDQKIDLLPMKAYPGLHSTAEKRLFTGKPGAVVVPAQGIPGNDLRLALDALVSTSQRRSVYRPTADPALGDKPPESGLRGSGGQRLQQQWQGRARRPGGCRADHLAGSRGPQSQSTGGLRQASRSGAARGAVDARLQRHFSQPANS